MNFTKISLRVDADPSDPVYRQRHAADMIEGFRLLSLLIFSSMAVLLIVHIARPDVAETGRHGGPSTLACALLTGASGVALLASKSVRSAATALLATATLLVASVAVITVDCLQQEARGERSTTSLLPILLSVLMLSSAILPLRPSRMLGLAVLLVVTIGLAARLTNTPFQIHFVDVVSAAIFVAVSAMTAARSTADRIRIHQAHSSAMEAQRQADAARERALLAESAVTMERLAASLSHELNTPIGVLRSATETLVRAFRKQASFPNTSANLQMVEQLFSAVGTSTTRLAEVVARVQRFANLDHSTLRLVDINQLVQDAVALMNPPSANQAQVRVRLGRVPRIWCRPQALNVAIASILNVMLDSTLPVTIRTELRDSKVTVKMTRRSAETGFDAEQELNFAVVDGRMRASGWDLFAARQLVRENGGDIRLEAPGSSQQGVTISLPADLEMCMQEATCAVAGAH